MTRSTAMAFALALAALSPAAARAQTTGAAEAAQATFQRGVAALGARRYEEAVAALSESYRTYPSPVALYNLGLAHRELGHFAAAVDAFERYLREAGDQASHERVRTVREAVRAMRERFAEVTLRVSAPGYAVLVDGRPAQVAGDVVTIDPGEHVLVVSAPEHRPWREPVTLAPGQRTRREVTLEREAAARPGETAAAAVAAAATPATPHPRDDAPTRAAQPAITSRWWFWTGLGVLVAGGVVAAVVAADANAATEPPVQGTRFDVQALTGR